MAIEDGYQLAMDLSDAIASAPDGYPDIPATLQVGRHLACCFQRLSIVFYVQVTHRRSLLFGWDWFSI